MTPIWLGLPALLAAALLGAGVELTAGRGLDSSALGHLTRVAIGLALFAASVVHPLVGLISFGVLCFLARAPKAAPEKAETSTQPTRIALAAIGLAALIVLLRPPVPLVWDEAVWLARVRVAADGPWALANRALDAHGGLVPSGYPIGAGALEAAFALFRSDLASITAGGGVLVLFSLSAFALSLASSARVDRVAVACVLAGAPLAWIHLRTGMLDLPLGLLAASFVLASDRPLLSAALAISMAVLKDEGAMYVVVASACSFFFAPAPAARARQLSSAALALLVVVTWRMRLAAAGVEAEHHSFASFEPAALPALLRELARAAADPLSFGASTAAILAAALLASRVPAARPIALTLALSLLVTLGALVVGPDAVRVFALEGTLFPRLVVQLVPLGAVLVGAVLNGSKDA